MKNISLMLFIILVISHPGWSQVNVLVNANEPIDEHRYEDIKRSPYLFNEFVEAVLVDTKTHNELRTHINYNGYEQAFEFEINGKKYLLDAKYYARISMKNGPLNPAYSAKNMSGDSTIFIKGLNPNDFQNYYISLLFSDRFNIIKSYEVDLIEREVQDVGRTIVRKYFAPKFYYFVVKDGQISQFKLNKKGVTSIFNNKAINDYIKSNKLSMKEDADLMKVIAFYQSIQ